MLCPADDTAVTQAESVSGSEIAIVALYKPMVQRIGKEALPADDFASKAGRVILFVLIYFLECCSYRIAFKTTVAASARVA